MKAQNYASLETSKRLIDVGIVLETEVAWFFSSDSQPLLALRGLQCFPHISYPAPSMAEVWRELPLKESSDGTYARLLFYSHGISWITNADESFFPYKECGENPTDALIDLLIFVRKEKP